jgi:hypothetical protein
MLYENKPSTTTNFFTINISMHYKTRWPSWPYSRNTRGGQRHVFSVQIFFYLKFSVGRPIAMVNRSDLTQPLFRRFGPSYVAKPVCSNNEMTRGLDGKKIDKNVLAIRKIKFELTCLAVFGQGVKDWLPFVFWIVRVNLGFLSVLWPSRESTVELHSSGRR